MTVHSRVNRGLAISCWVLTAALGTSIALSSESRGAVAALILVAWLAYAIHMLLWAPSMRVGGEGVQVRNPFRSVDVPWEALIHVSTKLSLTLHTPGRRWPVWCAPQAGALLARRAARRQRDDRDPESPLDVGVPVGDLRGTESGDAAALVRERWAAHGTDGDAEAATVTVAVRWPRIALLVLGPLLASVVPLLV